MSVQGNETNSPENTEIEHLPQKVDVPVYAISVSWKWLIVGLVCIVGIAGAATGIYFFQRFNMPEKVVDVARELIAEAEQDRKKSEEVSSPDEKVKLLTSSLKKRSEAVDILNNYRRGETGETNVSILSQLYEVTDSLYEDYGMVSTVQGRKMNDTLRELAVELSNSVTGGNSIEYRTRLLRLNWDRHSLPDVISSGLSLFRAAQAVGDRENYEALRYIAFACFEQIPLRPYTPTDHQLPSSAFPDDMDALLGKLNVQEPGDIEVAKRYAEFIVGLDHLDPNRQGNYRACASQALINKTPAERINEARACIDKMVSLNKNDSSAFLARYHFINQFLRQDSDAVTQSREDLKTVLSLSPNLPEGLILSSVDCIRQSNTADADAAKAAAAGDPDRAAEFQKTAEGLRQQAEEYLRRTVRYNPGEPYGYQYLGDFLLVRRKLDEAVTVWNEGITRSVNSANEELIGRLITVLLEQRGVTEARQKLDALKIALASMRYDRLESDVRRVNNLLRLLTAQLYLTEASVAASLMGENQQQSYLKQQAAIVQQRKSAAIQEFDTLLRNFGTDESDYVFERESIYEKLLPRAMLQAGELKLDWGEWDSAATYFRKALSFRIPSVQEKALLGMSLAYQQGNNLDEAVRALRLASEANPQDLSLKYAYTDLSFRTQVASNTVTTEALDTLQEDFETLKERQNAMNQPWVLDIRLVHLGYVRASLSNDAQVILDAMKEAVGKFQELETQEYPLNADGSERGYKYYIDDPAFVSEMAGIYSGLEERADFDRLLEKLRTFPNGEDAYYEARMVDFLRHGDNSGAMAFIEEASANAELSAAKKERFAALLQTLKTENVSSADQIYNQLRTTFDESPESLKPQAFLLLGELSLENGDIEQAKRVKDRLEALEGTASGACWRYMAVRIMLAENNPDFEQMRLIQEDVAKYRPEWDKTFVLRTMIEEQYLASSPGDIEARDILINNYAEAIRHGNVQPEMWERYADLLRVAGRTEESRAVILDAARNGVILQARTGQIPQPYGRMYSQVQEAIENEDTAGADRIAQSCISLAVRRGEKADLIFTLNLLLGKVFLDGEMYGLAERHLTETAQRGDNYIYPLALCKARAGNPDEGFEILLNEMDKVPSSLNSLLPCVLLLLREVKPSEGVYERIDRVMNRIERGTRLTLFGKAEDYEDGSLPLRTTSVDRRRIRSLVVRFPEKSENIDVSSLHFITPEEWNETESLE